MLPGVGEFGRDHFILLPGGVFPSSTSPHISRRTDVSIRVDLLGECESIVPRAQWLCCAMSADVGSFVGRKSPPQDDRVDELEPTRLSHQPAGLTLY